MRRSSVKSPGTRPISNKKPVVDISGLELLSNSIEQLEQLKPSTQNVGAVLELERSSLEGEQSEQGKCLGEKEVRAGRFGELQESQEAESRWRSENGGYDSLHYENRNNGKARNDEQVQEEL
ncbi:hypothetical protein K0M31_013812 [Melipona bicolor]|uniref:Uncharacterized protein n=1 Tax=Melipona bicolor TaxID=60889 RepID=A0AA40KGA2_9HYME|nr:hypothetical protein K0M31_013812 [Melipona bicolor]